MSSFQKQLLIKTIEAKIKMMILYPIRYNFTKNRNFIPEKV